MSKSVHKHFLKHHYSSKLQGSSLLTVSQRICAGESRECCAIVKSILQVHVAGNFGLCTPCVRHVYAMCTPCVRHVYAICTPCY